MQLYFSSGTEGSSARPPAHLWPLEFDERCDWCGGGVERHLFLAPPSFRRISLFDQPVLQYIDGGSIPVLGASTDASISTSSQVTLSGYLLDCVTTPCAAIAP